MENSLTTLEKLVQKAEAASKSSFELYKNKVIFESAEIVSKLAVKIILALIFCFFSIFVTIGLSLWIGKLLGETFLGFFVLSAAYLLIGIVMYLFRNSLIENPVCDAVIKQFKKI